MIDVIKEIGLLEFIYNYRFQYPRRFNRLCSKLEAGINSVKGPGLWLILFAMGLTLYGLNRLFYDLE